MRNLVLGSLQHFVLVDLTMAWAIGDFKSKAEVWVVPCMTSSTKAFPRRLWSDFTVV